MAAVQFNSTLVITCDRSFILCLGFYRVLVSLNIKRGFLLLNDNDLLRTHFTPCIHASAEQRHAIANSVVTLSLFVCLSVFLCVCLSLLSGRKKQNKIHKDRQKDKKQIIERHTERKRRRNLEIDLSVRHKTETHIETERKTDTDTETRTKRERQEGVPQRIVESFVKFVW